MDEQRLFDPGNATIRSRARSAPKQLTASDVLEKGNVYSVGFGSQQYLYRADRPTQAHSDFLTEHFGWRAGEMGRHQARLSPPPIEDVVIRKLTPDDIERLIAVDPRAAKRVMR